MMQADAQAGPDRGDREAGLLARYAVGREVEDQAIGAAQGLHSALLPAFPTHDQFLLSE